MHDSIINYEVAPSIGSYYVAQWVQFVNTCRYWSSKTYNYLDKSQYIKKTFLLKSTEGESSSFFDHSLKIHVEEILENESSLSIYFYFKLIMRIRYGKINSIFIIRSFNFTCVIGGLPGKHCIFSRVLTHYFKLNLWAVYADNTTVKLFAKQKLRYT